MLLKLTSAIIKPFSKSLWIFPAACGALVPFWEGGRERERERERDDHQYTEKFGRPSLSS